MNGFGFNPFGNFAGGLPAGPAFGPSIGGFSGGPMGVPGYSPYGFGMPTFGGGFSPGPVGGFTGTPATPPGSGGPVNPSLNPAGSSGGVGASGSLAPSGTGTSPRDQYGAALNPGVGSPWGQAPGMPSMTPGSYNPWMSQLGPQGAMSMMQNSPFTGYFNQMAAAGAPGIGPMNAYSLLQGVNSYGGLQERLGAYRNMYNDMWTARQQAAENGGGGSGPSAEQAAGGVGLGALALGSPYAIPAAGAAWVGKKIWDWLS